MKQKILLTAREIEVVAGGKWQSLVDGELNITGVNFNPQRVTEGDLYIVRNWKAVDGTDTEGLVRRAFKQGAVAAVVPAGDIRESDYPLLEVTNPHKALHDMAAGSSLKYNGLRILVTGSHGKTGFKTQLYHLIRRQMPTHANIDSGNKAAAIWRALASIPRGTKVFIVELAVPSRRFGEEGTSLILPHYCVITGIGFEHLRSHKTLGNLIRNKALTVTGLRTGGKCLLNSDDEHYPALKSEVKKLSTCDILTFGSAPDCHGRLLKATFSELAWRVRTEILGNIIEYDLPLCENYAPLASVGVLLMAKLLDADLQACAAEYADYRNFESSGNLYRIKTAIGNIWVYDQAQRGEVKGFESMFELMSRLHPEGGGRKIAVVSEFINLEDNPGITVDVERMRFLMETAGIGILFTVREFKRYERAVPAGLEWRLHGNTQEDIREELLHTVRENDMVFIRGVMSAKMGNLVKALLSKGGHTVEKIY
jgi:UDP-N-acetylmuramoyl-tripeptide--D-alanyl-D-alanine ligase